MNFGLDRGECLSCRFARCHHANADFWDGDLYLGSDTQAGISVWVLPGMAKHLWYLSDARILIISVSSEKWGVSTPYADLNEISLGSYSIGSDSQWRVIEAGRSADRVPIGRKSGTLASERQSWAIHGAARVVEPLEGWVSTII